MHHEQLQYLIGKHIAHHKDVNPDMTLMNAEEPTSVHFGWGQTIMVFFVMIVINTAIINKLFEFEMPMRLICMISFMGACMYNLSWNYYHIRYHMLHNKHYNEWSAYEKYAFRNHMIHHAQKGKRKGNYAIILLGADSLFGTNNTCIDNTEYCKQDRSTMSESGRRACEMQDKQIPHGYGIEYCKKN